MTAACPDEFVAFAERLADAGRDILLRYFRTDVAIDDKPDATPVTVADRETEAALREMVAERFPGHGFVGEEYAATDAGASHVWVVDPIDGTKSFVSGNPVFGSLIALVRDGTPVLGIIDHPALGDRWIGAAGRPTTHNGRPVRVRPCPDIGSAIYYCSSPYMFPEADRAAFERLRAAVRFTRFSADCLAYGLLASGFVDLVVEADLGVFDFCALIPVVAGAGGTVTDWQGRPVTLESDGRLAAVGDAALHRRVLDLIAG